MWLWGFTCSLARLVPLVAGSHLFFNSALLPLYIFSWTFLPSFPIGQISFILNQWGQHIYTAYRRTIPQQLSTFLVEAGFLIEPRVRGFLLILWASLLLGSLASVEFPDGHHVFPTFLLGLGFQTLILILAKQALYLLSHSLYLPPSSFLKKVLCIKLKSSHLTWARPFLMSLSLQTFLPFFFFLKSDECLYFYKKHF